MEIFIRKRFLMYYIQAKLEISDGAKGIVLNPNSGGNQNSSYINTTSGNLTINSTGGNKKHLQI